MFGRAEDDDGLEALQARIGSAREIITDPERTEFRVVLVPERMAISESERLVAKLDEAGICVDYLVVNRVLEDAAADCPRCQSRLKRHERRLAAIRETFPGREIVTVPEAEGEIQGPDALADVADRLPPVTV